MTDKFRFGLNITPTLLVHLSPLPTYPIKEETVKQHYTICKPLKSFPERFSLKMFLGSIFLNI